MFWHIYILPWPVLLMLMPAVAVFWGVMINVLRSRKIIVSLCIFLFAVWVVVVLDCTLMGRDVMGRIGFAPLFDSYCKKNYGAETLRSNFMNILLFVPGGLVLFEGLSARRRWLRFLVVFAVLSGLSICIEYLQYCYALGVPEMDDIFHNTIGALLGAGMAWCSPYGMKRIFTKIRTWSTNDEKTE